MIRQDNTKLLPFHKLQPLVQRNPDAELAWIGHDFLDGLPEEAGGPKFLGFDADRTPHFAVDISAVEDPSKIAALASDAAFEDGRAAATDIPQEQSGILAQARANLNWHSQHRFCSVCGTESQSLRGGLMRQCPNCSSQHFPRTDPVAIMLVYKGDKCVMGQTLARQNSSFYSCLAGFIDQGESIEEGVRREVREESGLQIGKVTYHSSQPWPFPSSLMLGFRAEAINNKLDVNFSELEIASWFTKDFLKASPENDSFRMPGKVSIARRLIEEWINED